MLTRIGRVQREQIAALKAFGYANREIGWHFAKWSLVVGGAGSLIGLAAGAWMGSAMTGLYNLIFKLPGAGVPAGGAGGRRPPSW